MKRYDRDFKIMILELHKSGQTIKSLSLEYDVSRAAIQNWKRLYSALPESFSDNHDISVESYTKLQEENARLREEVDVLKKCVDIFSNK
ncbi:MAG: transposase [Clostridiales bacterium]|nr:transposase [Clostridiales bacterium]